MAPWTVSWPFGSAGPDLPESINPSKGGPDTAFEVFIDGALTKIYNEASGRSKEHRAIREECKNVLERLRGAEGKETQPITTPLDANATAAVLEPLRLACATGNPKLVEPALGCLHKLVSHAYLQAESSPGGRLDDGTAVSQVVQLVSKCGEFGGEATQLAVLRALLTIATAEHFVVHGDCLMQTVRTAFNVAIGAESQQIQQTARNALLQMLNTIVKRVTQFPLSRLASMASASSTSMDRAALLAGVSEGLQETIHEDPAEGAEDAAEPEPETTSANTGSDGGRSEAHSPKDTEAVDADGKAVEQQPGATTTLGAEEQVAAPDIGSGDDQNGVSEEAAAAEEAVEEGVPGGLGDTRTAELATLAENADLRGLEKALDRMQAERGQQAEQEARGSAAGGEEAVADQDVRRVVMREKRLAAWRHLSLNERDVLTVLSAICKMAARDTGFGAVETLLHHGKLLSLDLLVRVLENPLHNWNNVRPEFCEQLRQYLWPALLRNSLSPYQEAFAAVARLLALVLAAPRLRAGLKAEIGAFFPLILLRPLEAERCEAWQQLAALDAVKSICADAQLLTDVFVNYDCDLQASNLLERMLKGLALVAGGRSVGAPEAARAAAADALLLLIKALNKRAQPLKEVAEASAAPQQEGQAALPSRTSEVARFGAIKEKKLSLEAGIALFNRDAVKGVNSLISSGTVEGTPSAVAAFLRTHSDVLDTTQIGEYFGHHEEFAIAAMHAYIDEERYAGLTIDAALRLLLRGFRLPGEAQKIDRIMEKFAERFCLDNEGTFATADGAYLLAFALIMLNTDAHNPRAEKKLSCQDFVTMCQAQDETGAFAPILPPSELEAMYARILEREIPLPSSEAQPAKPLEDGTQPRLGVPASRLAAALGLSHLFRSADWDKQRGVDVERARLMQATQQLVARGQHTWHSATHVEHVRPMLQVGGEHVRKGLTAALEGAADAEAAKSLLEGFTVAIRLAGLLDLDQVVDGLITSLAAAAAVSSPALPGSAAEGKQLAALAALLEVAAGPDAGYLGSGWVTVLRTLSALEQLKERTAAESNSAAAAGLVEHQPAAATAAAGLQGPLRSRSFGRGLLSRLGLVGDPAAPSADGNPKEAEEVQASDAARPPDGNGENVVFHGPGAAMVMWSEAEGQEAVERVFTGSADLNGDAVVVFMRAVCAVSQEELIPDDPSQPARTYLLGRLAESAFHNLGRIRLIWGRLWAAVAPQLVAAACHSDGSVAVLAVEHMRRLITKLLARAELAHFTYQEDALRPLVAVLRHSDSTDARERVVALIAHAVTAHTRSLGSGWRSLLAALRVAAADGSPAVVDGALDALQALTPALWRGVGLEAESLPDVCAALECAIRNPTQERLSIAATAAVPPVAARLAAAASDQEEPLATRQSSGSAASPHAPPGSPVSQAEAAWSQIAKVLAMVGRHDPRPAVADAAVAALLEILGAHSAGWSSRQWGAFWGAGLAYVLSLPQQQFVLSQQQVALNTAPSPVGWSSEGLLRIQRHATACLGPLCDAIRESYPSSEAVFEQVLGLLASYVQQPRARISGLGVQLLKDAVAKLAPVLDNAAWPPVLRFLSMASAPELASPILRPGTGEAVDDGLGEAVVPERAARNLCRSAVLMQQTCAQILTTCSHCMPPEAQSAVLDVLQDSVQRALAFNANPRRRRATTSLLAPATPAGLGSRASSAPALENGHAKAGEAVGTSDESDAEEEEAAASAAGPDSLVALGRQEAEGGLLLLSLLVQRLPKGAVPCEEGVARDAEQRLLRISRRLLSVATSPPRPEGSAEELSSSSTEPHDWTQEVRAPLVEAVLKSFESLETGVWQQELPALWPHLVRLIVSGQPSVRSALASLLDAQVQPAFNQMAG